MADGRGLMVVCDVNVLLFDLVAHSAHHRRCRAELDVLRRSTAVIGVSELVLSAVYRIATNPKVFKPTPRPALVLRYLQAWRSLPQARMVRPGPRHWTLYTDLLQTLGIVGSASTDAYLAALAMEQGAEWWTADVDFGRFPGLRWRNLLQET